MTALLGPVNLGNPIEKSVRELAELILDITGSRSALIFTIHALKL
jgi:nucleoside-diphosphate-sugar epimerase